METFLIYQLKVAVLAAVMYLLYKWLLSKQTFHSFNRAMLLLICALSFILPACRFKDIRLTDEVRKVFPVLVKADITEAPHTQTSVKQVVAQTSQGDFYDDANAGTQEMVSVGMADLEQPIDETVNIINWKQIANTGLFVIWCIGFLWLLLRKLISLLSIRKLISEGRYQDRQDECNLIETDVISQPMNWMNFIMMPHDWIKKENQAVWKHELSHARKAHSIDLLIMDLMQLFQWFNPIMLLLYKEMELLHEFQADHAVIESGANARQYKMMLVNAVAENRGFAMTSWLRQTNLKQRIDMMQRKESNRWNRLRALFVPIVAAAFTLVNSSMASAQDQNFHWEPFQDGKTWVYENGNAKVRTVDGVEANMKATEVADYLANYKSVNTTRMTLRYMYNVDDLNVAYPLARSLADKGIHVSIANNDDMLTKMTMPEYRTPAIFDLGAGQFRFEVNCNLKTKVHADTIGVDLYGAGDQRVVNPSVTGSLDEVMKWIDLFDGHGLAIYPKTMTTREADKIAKAVWKRGLDQVSIVSDSIIKGKAHDMFPCNYRITTIVPKNYSFEKEFGNISALDAVKRMNVNQTSAYYGKGQRIEHPQFFAGDAWHEITDVINGPDELILITRICQGSYQWVIGFSDCEIEADGKRYEMTRSEGMEGFEQTYFWSPTFAYFYQTLHFPAIPDNVQTVNFYENNPTNTIIKLQVVPDIDIFEGVRIVKYPENYNSYVLQTTHVNEDPGIRDVLSVERVDFTDNETTVYCQAYVRNAHSYPGHISSDFKLTLAGGRVLEPVRYEGVPTDQDFDRHGDWVGTPFQLVFPAISQEEWEQGTPILTGSVLHEPCTIEIREREFAVASPVKLVPLDSIPENKYFLDMELINKTDDNMQYIEKNAKELGLDSIVDVKVSDNKVTLTNRNGKISRKSGKCTLEITGHTSETKQTAVYTIPAGTAVVEMSANNGRKAKGYGYVLMQNNRLLQATILFTEGDDDEITVMMLTPWI